MSKKDRERVALYLSWGMTPRMARKKMMILHAHLRAGLRRDRRRMKKWMHANTRFDTTAVNGPWCMNKEAWVDSIPGANQARTSPFTTQWSRDADDR